MNSQYQHQYRQIGKRIAYYRKKRRMTQTALAIRINHSLQFVRLLEDNYEVTGYQSKCPWSVKSLDLLFLIADALQVDLPIFFLPESDEHFEQYRTDKTILN